MEARNKDGSGCANVNVWYTWDNLVFHCLPFFLLEKTSSFVFIHQQIEHLKWNSISFLSGTPEI
jgi:hypothetical protein